MPVTTVYVAKENNIPYPQTTGRRAIFGTSTYPFLVAATVSLSLSAQRLFGKFGAQ